MAAEPRTVVTADPAETRALAARLARALPPGAVVALHGDLGAGKTCFVAGLAAGLGIDEDVTSPTYTLMHEYRAAEGDAVLLHFDAWMAGRERGFLEGGGAEWLATGAVAAVEWAERVEAFLPDPHVRVELRHVDERHRAISLDVAGSGAGPPTPADLHRAIATALDPTARPASHPPRDPQPDPPADPPADRGGEP